jgi:hypothetical protein
MKWDKESWTGFFWFMIGTYGELECGIETSVSIKFRDLLTS